MISSPKSVSSSPFKLRVIEATGKTLTDPAFLAFSIIYLVISGLSFTGSVFAMHTTDVNPPKAAALVPLAMSSFHSKPGSLK